MVDAVAVWTLMTVHDAFRLRDFSQHGVLPHLGNTIFILTRSVVPRNLGSKANWLDPRNIHRFMEFDSPQKYRIIAMLVTIQQQHTCVITGLDKPARALLEKPYSHRRGLAVYDHSVGNLLIFKGVDR